MNEEYLKGYFNTYVLPNKKDATYEDWVGKIKDNDTYKQGMFNTTVLPKKSDATYSDWNNKVFGTVAKTETPTQNAADTNTVNAPVVSESKETTKTPITDQLKSLGFTDDKLGLLATMTPEQVSSQLGVDLATAQKYQSGYLSEQLDKSKENAFKETTISALKLGSGLELNQVTKLFDPNYTTVEETIKDAKGIDTVSPTETQEALKILGRKDYDVSPENLQLSLQERNYLEKVLKGEKTPTNSLEDYFDKNFGTDWENIKKSYAGKQIESVAKSVQQISKAVNTPDPDFLKNTTNILKNSINIVFSAIPQAQVFMALQEGVIQADAAYEAAINNDPSILEDNKGTFRDIIEYGMTLPTQQFKNWGWTKDGEETTASNLAGFMDIAWQMLLLHGTGKVIKDIKSKAAGEKYTRENLNELSKDFTPLRVVSDKIIKKEPITKADVNSVVDKVNEIRENPEYIKEGIEYNPNITEQEKQRFNDRLELDEQIKALQEKVDIPKTPELFIDKDTQATLDKIDANEPVVNADLQTASTNLYNEYKRLEAIKASDTRQVTTGQINAAQWSLGEAVTELDKQIKNQIDTGKFKDEVKKLPLTNKEVKRKNYLESQNRPLSNNETIELKSLNDRFNDAGEFDINKIPKEKITQPISLDLTKEQPPLTPESVLVETKTGDAKDIPEAIQNVRDNLSNEVVGANKPVVETPKAQILDYDADFSEFVRRVSSDFTNLNNIDVYGKNAKEIAQVLRDLKANKDSVTVRRYLNRLKEMYDSGVVETRTGYLGSTDKMQVPIADFLKEIEKQEVESVEVPQRFTDAKEQFGDEMASDIIKNDITLDNFEKVKAETPDFLFDTPEAKEQYFNDIKEFLDYEKSRTETGGTTTEPTATGQQTTGVKETGIPAPESVKVETEQAATAEPIKTEAPLITEVKPESATTKKETLQAKSDVLKQSISDRLGRLSNIKEAISDAEKPEILKELAGLITDAVKLGEIKLEQGIEYLKEKLPNLKNFIESNKDDIVKAKEVGGEDTMIGIRKVDLEQIAEESGFTLKETESVSSEVRKSMAEEAVKKGYDAKGLLAKIDKGDYTPTALEIEILKQYEVFLNDKASKDPTDANLSEFREFVQTARLAGSKAGASLQALQGLTDKTEITLADYFNTRMEAAGVDTLTEAQKALDTEQYNKITEANKKLQESNDKLTSEVNRLKAENELKNIAKTIRKRKPTEVRIKEIKTEISNIIANDIVAQWKLASADSTLSAVPLPYAKQLAYITPGVVKLVGKYVELGATELSAITESVYNELRDKIPAITKNDIQNVIAGEYKEKATRTQNELKARERDIIEESKLINKLQKLEEGNVPKTERKKVIRNKKITDLRKQIKGHGVTKLSSLKKRYETELAKVQEDLKTGNYLKEKAAEIPILENKEVQKQHPELYKETIDAKDKLIEAKLEREASIAEEVYKNRSKSQKALDMAQQVVDAVRILKTNPDLSAFLRQGAIYSVAHPISGGRFFGKSVKMALSPKTFERWQYDFHNSPMYVLANKAGLAITNPRELYLSKREEMYRSNLVQKVPGIGHVVKGSERAFLGFLNMARVDLFTRGVEKLRSEGYTFENNKKAYKDLASMVNNVTGRGGLGKLEPVADLLSIPFWSPRLMASRINLFLNPVYYAKLSKPVRTMLVKDMVKFIGFGVTTMTLASMLGADVEYDPRSSDFGSIKVGNTRYNIWGGGSQYIRVIAQILTGRRKETGTEKVKKLTGDERIDIATRFTRGKLSPVWGFGVDVGVGKNIVGEEVKLKDAWKLAIPMLYEDIKDAAKDGDIANTLAAGTGSILGVGVQTYEKKKKKFSTSKKNSDLGDKIESEKVGGDKMPTEKVE